ncbi:NADH-quinone oxidoreductase subunit M [Granulicella pectinivorans]|uniref:NADH-quinone oxidoreductase subunit M n=1 Tax=Granulicella pectinivorans TaxID=474950 RepID=A0A1I6L7Z4_9BACT|nr:NADH-quinone oxidoreductase subunit M [Granulicella pectinivorans]SFR99544.1 NADH-quinone oxidoreductase subunit M [Granulicella pectinivorans]
MLLTLITALPVLGAVATLACGNNRKLARILALTASLAALALAIYLACHFDATTTALQCEERYAWVPALNIEYRVGIDGLGLLMVLLSSIVVPIGIAASWSIEDKPALYFALMLLLQACLFGAFTALNFIPWFTYWELSIIPAFFLIKLWGGPQRSPAAMQFLVYTMVGSVAMLLAFLALFLATNQFDFLALANLAQTNQLAPKLAGHVSPFLLFAGVFLGFAVKVPLMPFHTWLPPAYSEAPSGTTAVLTGAMSKMGLYGFLRILLPLFAPQMREVLTPLLWLAAATVVFSAYAALAQKDLKRTFAYSSINHLGYCLLALFAIVKFTADDSARQAALSGLMLQMFSHGLTAATIFWFIALIEQRANGQRGLNDFGGLRKIAPVFTGLMGIALFSSLGLPGLNGFIPEFLIFKGAFPLVTWATSLSAIGLMITAIVMLTILQRVFSGPLNAAWSTFPDLTSGERLALAPAIALMFVLGLYPQLLLGLIHSTVTLMTHQLKF